MGPDKVSGACFHSSQLSAKEPEKSYGGKRNRKYAREGAGEFAFLR
jgi:hypothetical protein